MSRPSFPAGCILPPRHIRRVVDEQHAYDRDPEGYEREQEWSLDACIERGSLPTGESIEALFGTGPWTGDTEP